VSRRSDETRTTPASPSTKSIENCLTKEKSNEQRNGTNMTIKIEPNNDIRTEGTAAAAMEEGALSMTAMPTAPLECAAPPTDNATRKATGVELPNSMNPPTAARAVRATTTRNAVVPDDGQASACKRFLLVFGITFVLLMITGSIRASLHNKRQGDTYLPPPTSSSVCSIKNCSVCGTFHCGGKLQCTRIGFLRDFSQYTVAY